MLQNMFFILCTNFKIYYFVQKIMAQFTYIYVTIT